MKLGIYSDVHYSTVKETNKTRRPSLSASKIEKLNEIFKAEAVDAVLCLGDIINSEKDRERDIKNLSYITDIMRGCDCPLFTLPGNHDFETLSTEEYYSVLKQDIAPYRAELCGVRFVFLDCCYIDDSTENGVHYDRGNFDWKNSYLSEAQLEYLKEASAGAEKVYVCTHQNLDDRDNPHCIRNAERVREVIRECKNIVGVFSGHYHRGCRFEIDGIPYITPVALCEGEELNYLILEL